MPFGGSQKSRYNWWQAASNGRNWFSTVKARSTGTLADTAAIKTHTKLTTRRPKG